MSKTTKPENVTVWQMVRDLTIYSMDKGLFLPFGFLATIMLLIWKLPPQDTKAVLVAFIGNFKNLSTLGWVVAIGVIAMWGYHTKWLSKSLNGEIDRLVGERNKLQQSLSESTITSTVITPNNNNNKTPKLVEKKK